MTVRSAERWVAGLVVSIVGLACGGAEPDPAGATEDGTSTGAATSTGADSSAGESSTTLMLPDVGPPRPSQTLSCATWMACATELDLESLPKLDAAYGIDGTCWDGDAAQATACDGMCTEELAATVMELEAMGQVVPEACDPMRMVSWAEIEAIIEDRCVTACHEPGGEDPSLDLSEEPYFAIYGVASSQSALSIVEPGIHEESYLWHKVNGSHGSVNGSGSRMPRDSQPLPQFQIDAIADWIDGGAEMF